MFEIGIVIRTYNEAELLPRTLDSLMAQKEQSFEIILVDSGSTDATVQIARGFERVKIIQIHRKDFTYGRALNMGIAAAGERVKYIAMLSGHAIPCDETWLGELVAPMFRDPHVAGVYGKQIPLPEHIENPIVRALAADAYPKCYGDDVIIITNGSSSFSCSNSAIRSDSWFRFKFNEALPASEDQLWSKTVIDSGGRIAYQPTAAVYHSHPDTFERFFRRRYHEEYAGRLIDPSRYPLMATAVCLRSLKGLLVSHVHNTFLYRSMFGAHWDEFRFKLVNVLAAYKGRRDAE